MLSLVAMEYDYELFVIGGGSGGLAAAKAAADLGAKVAVADFVKPSPAGTTWGLGGTCVNVGCIPKKLMHISSLYRESQQDAHGMGWETKSSHSWSSMVTQVDNYIKSLNWGAKTDLRTKAVKYFNAFASFKDPHTLSLDNGKGKIEEVSAKYILIACGGRPTYGDYPGVRDCCISSDDIFWQKKAPGKTLVVGASYIALECAGFIAALGFDVTVMVRSILLRGFDQDISNMIGDYMQRHGVNFAREMVPSKFEKTSDGKVKVFVKDVERLGRLGSCVQICESLSYIYERPSKPTSTNLVKRGHKASLTSRIYSGTIGPPPKTIIGDRHAGTISSRKGLHNKACAAGCWLQAIRKVWDVSKMKSSTSTKR